MPRLLLILGCFAISLAVVIGDIEYEEHGHHRHHHHHHSHDGHDHHDHESHQKLFSDNVGDDEQHQKENLRSIAKKIDTNHDGQVSREEMRVYVEERLAYQQHREADEMIETLDPEKTKKVTFSAYAADSFGDIDKDQLEKDGPIESTMREIRRTYLTDKAKWAHLDKNKDNALSYDEFRIFLHPEDNDDLRRIEINSVLKEYDTNGDRKLSADEYGTMTEYETGKFETLTEEVDTNNDGHVDFDELSRYYLPPSTVNVDEETDHLLNECDKNRNGFCTPDQIVKAYSTFIGSQVTDYGADLDSFKEEL